MPIFQGIMTKPAIERIADSVEKDMDREPQLAFAFFGRPNIAWLL